MTIYSDSEEEIGMHEKNLVLEFLDLDDRQDLITKVKEGNTEFLNKLDQYCIKKRKEEISRTITSGLGELISKKTARDFFNKNLNKDPETDRKLTANENQSEDKPQNTHLDSNRPLIK